MHCIKMEKEVILVIYDSFSLSLAIEIAGRNMPRIRAADNLMIKSLFILINALEKLGEHVQVLPFAVTCKHLSPKVSDFNESKPILHRNCELAIELRGMRQFYAGFLHRIGACTC